jgi:hypothetical protein
MSKLFSLNWHDIIKGFIVTAFTTFISSLVAVLDTLQFPDSEGLKHILLAGLAAGCSYFIKNFFTNSEGKMSLKEPQ